MSSKRRLPAGSQALTKAGEADGKAVVEVVSPKRGQSQKKVRGRRRKPDALLEVANVTAGQARALEGGIPAASGAMFYGMRLGNRRLQEERVARSRHSLTTRACTMPCLG